MQRLYSLLSILILASFLAGCAGNANAHAQEFAPEQSAPTELPEKSETVSKEPPAECPVTVPRDPTFAPPGAYSELGFEGQFLYGSGPLWTRLPSNGVWSGLPKNQAGYTQKIFWWSELFSIRDEPQPALTVFGERLDADAPSLSVSKATNASAGDIGIAMLVGVDFPTPGCWQVTGQYKKSELRFVVWVAP